MHLVFATSIVPDGAPATGYEIANAAIIDALRRAGIRVTVLGFTWPGKAPSDPGNTVVLGSVDVRTDSASALQKAAWLMQAVFEGVTFASVKLRAVSRDRVRAALQAHRAVRRLCRSTRCRSPARSKGCSTTSRRSSSRTMSSSARPRRMPRPRAARSRNICTTARRACSRQVERRLCDKAKFVFTLADEDRAALGVDAPGKSAALPLVTPASKYMSVANRDAGVRRDADRHLDLAAQPHRPRMVPATRSFRICRDDFRIAIAGSMPADLSSPHPGVAFVGRVADAIAFVRSGRVVPLISRAG